MRNSDVFWPSDSDEAVNAANAEKESERSEASAYLLLDLGSSRKPIS